MKQREIKFRAWDGSIEKMFYDAFSIQSFGSVIDIGWKSKNVKEIIYQQYTGLHDKNDKEIYEGDIVNYEDGCNEEIIFENCSFVGKGIKSGKTSMIGDCKIIGNIYENPELLEK